MNELARLLVEELDARAKVNTTGGAKRWDGTLPFDPIITLPVEPIVGEPIICEFPLGSGL